MEHKSQPNYNYLMMAGHVVCDMNQSTVPALLPFLVLGRGIDYAAAAGLMFASSFLSSLIQPLLGMLSDRKQFPWLMGVGILMTGIGIASIGFLEHYWAIFAAVMFSGMGSAVFHPEGGRMANRLAGEKKGRGMSTFQAGGSLGFVIGPMLAVFAVTTWGLRGTAIFLVPTLTMVAILFAMQSRFMRAASPINPPPGSQADPSAAVDDWPSLRKLCISIFSRSIVMNGLLTFIPLYWVGILLQSQQQGSLMLTAMALAGTAAAFTGGILADRFGFSRVIRLTFVFIPLLMLLLPFTSHLWLAVALTVSLAALINLGHSPAIVLGQKYLPNRLGMASGITLGLAVSVGGVFSPLMGRIGDTFGLSSVFYVLAGVALLGALGTFLVKDPPVAKPAEAAPAETPQPLTSER
ncbi:MAG: MFS transporter [Oscillospiraceae bacterium]|nr:MFS transporter [Oscillospiraceae bacterium]